MWRAQCGHVGCVALTVAHTMPMLRKRPRRSLNAATAKKFTVAELKEEFFFRAGSTPCGDEARPTRRRRVVRVVWRAGGCLARLSNPSRWRLQQLSQAGGEGQVRRLSTHTHEAPGALLAWTTRSRVQTGRKKNQTSNLVSPRVLDAADASRTRRGARTPIPARLLFGGD